MYVGDATYNRKAVTFLLVKSWMWYRWTGKVV